MVINVPPQVSLQCIFNCPRNWCLRGGHVVFVALLCLTAITVGVSYLHLNRPLAITVALIIACVKAGMVAAVFMHLLDERKVIYAVLILTVAFFFLVLLLPMFTIVDGSTV